MNRDRVMLGIIAALLMGLGCQSQPSLPGIPFDDLGNPTQIPADLKISLERTVCYGWCPEYRVTIDAQGGVSYFGGRFVRFSGVRTRKVDSEHVRRLVSSLNAARFLAFSDNYNSKEDGCTDLVTDLPTAKLSLEYGNIRKVVWHYHGCWGPRELQVLIDLENMVDEVADTEEWIDSEWVGKELATCGSQEGNPSDWCKQQW